MLSRTGGSDVGGSILAVVQHPPPQATAADERPPSLLDEVRKAKHRSPDDTPVQSAAAARQQDAAPTQQHGHYGSEAVEEGGLVGLEDEAGQEGAFNPETGEINWDCPCLGGMAHGPWCSRLPYLSRRGGTDPFLQWRAIQGGLQLLRVFDCEP